MLAIQRLEREATLSPPAIDAFLAEHTFPLVEGRTVTFVFRGHADGVYLQHWIHSLTQQQPFARLPGTDLWFLSMELPEGSRVEYKLLLQAGGQRHLIRDPLNDNLAHDPYGANSVVYGSGYEVPDWTRPDTDARPGEIHDAALDSRALGDRREFQVYLPARFRESRRYPLLVVHDGPDYLRFASLREVLDNLIHRLEIPSLIVALIGSPNRLQEYGDDPRHAEFVTGELVPFLESRFPLFGTPSARCVMGASFGAIAALSTAWRKPGVFGNLLLQSGSFLFTDIGEHEGGPHFDPVADFIGEFRREPGRPADRLFLSCGTYEPMIYYNRSLVPLFQRTGMQVRFVEARDGHNWENWRDRLREGLSWLMPGPLWMVYE